MFGILGIIIGPIVAALFITVWEIYGKAFEAYLPDVGPLFEQSPNEEAIKPPEPSSQDPEAIEAVSDDVDKPPSSGTT
jgi:hypothetical protein